MVARLLGIALAVIVLAPWRVVGEEEGVVVIVHPRRPVKLSLEEVAQIYLRRRRFWDDGAAIVPLNMASDAPLRAQFAERVLNQSQARLADYWNRQYFQGILPPATLASTEAVRRYVASEPNAIGYVPASEVNRSVRVVLRLE
jgi:ABC-type phosphate transport system substrate-binding protein